MSRVLRATAETASVHGLLGWVYVAAIAVVRPQDMAQPISRLVGVRTDTFGMMCFALSVVASLVVVVGRGVRGRGEGTDRDA